MNLLKPLMPGLAIALATLLLSSTQVHGDFVRFDTTLGSFTVDLFQDETPGTVSNFLSYINADRYGGSIVHRSVPGAIIQGGGFFPGGTSVNTFGTIMNEPGISNLRGTIAMAKMAGDPNSATSQWYINTTDNTGLDSDNGGFTVFGEVIGNGMDVVDAINTLAILNGNPIVNGVRQDGPFTTVPVLDVSSSPVFGASNLVVINSVVSIPEPAGFSLLFATSLLAGCRRRRRPSAG